MGPQRRESGTGERGPGAARGAARSSRDEGRPARRRSRIGLGEAWECRAAESRCGHGALVGGAGFRKLGDSVSRVDGSTLPQ